MYSNVVNLFRQHRTEITREFAQVVRNAQLKSYLNTSDDFLFERFASVYDSMFDYLEERNVGKWQEICVQIIESRVRAGLDYREIIESNRMATRVLLDFFRRNHNLLELSQGEDISKLDSWLETRLDGMFSIAISTATATAVRVTRELSQAKKP